MFDPHALKTIFDSTKRAFIDTGIRNVDRQTRQLVSDIIGLSGKTRRDEPAQPLPELADEARAAALRLEDFRNLKDKEYPRLLALLRIIARRTLEGNLNARQNQIQAAIALLRGRIIQMENGEGKTLAAAIAACCGALKGEQVHISTYNAYLAKRDFLEMSPLYMALGLKAALLTERRIGWLKEMPPEQDTPEDGMYDEFSSFLDFLNVDETGEKPESFETGETHCIGGRTYAYCEAPRDKGAEEIRTADIVYGRISDFIFGYLGDQTTLNSDELLFDGRQDWLILDEADDTLIEEARSEHNMLNAATAEAEGTNRDFIRMFEVVRHFDERSGDIRHLGKWSATERGRQKAFAAFAVDESEEHWEYGPRGMEVLRLLDTMVNACFGLQDKKHYYIADDVIRPVCLKTGENAAPFGWETDIALRLKHGLDLPKVRETMRRVGLISIQHYVQLYGRLSGMTATAREYADEFMQFYGLVTELIPSATPCIRKDEPDRIYPTTADAVRGAGELTLEAWRTGAPVLIDCPYIGLAEAVRDYLLARGVRSRLLVAGNARQAASILATAGEPGAVTIAAKLAGRGTDIKVSPEARDKGGLLVIGLMRSMSPAIDAQVRGRTARRGAPGTSLFILSLDSEWLMLTASATRLLMRSFGLEPDVPISTQMVANAINRAQGKLLAAAYEKRRSIYHIDSFLDGQRTFVYGFRCKLLHLNTAIEGDIDSMVLNWATQVVTDHYPRKATRFSDAFIEDACVFGVFDPEDLQDWAGSSRQTVATRLAEELLYRVHRALPRMGNVRARVSLLLRLDAMWQNHLARYQALQQTILGNASSPDAYSRFLLELDRCFWLQLGELEQSFIHGLLEFPLGDPDEEDARPAERTFVAAEPRWRELPPIKGGMLDASPLKRLAGPANDPAQNLKIGLVLFALFFGLLYVPGWWDVSAWQKALSNPILASLDGLLTGRALSRGALLLFGILPGLLLQPRKLFKDADPRPLRWTLAVLAAAGVLSFAGVAQWQSASASALFLPLLIFLLPYIILRRRVSIFFNLSLPFFAVPLGTLAVLFLVRELTGSSLPLAEAAGTLMILCVLWIGMGMYQLYLLRTKQIVLPVIILLTLLVSTFDATYAASKPLMAVYAGSIILFAMTGAWLFKAKSALAVERYSGNERQDTVIEIPFSNALFFFCLVLLTVPAGLVLSGVADMVAAAVPPAFSFLAGLCAWPLAGTLTLGLLTASYTTWIYPLITRYVSTPLVLSLFEKGYLLKNARSIEHAAQAITAMTLRRIQKMSLFLILGLILHAALRATALFLTGRAASFPPNPPLFLLAAGCCAYVLSRIVGEFTQSVDIETARLGRFRHFDAPETSFSNELDKDILQEAEEMFRAVMADGREHAVRNTIGKCFSWGWRPRGPVPFTDVLQAALPAAILSAVTVLLPLHVVNSLVPALGLGAPVQLGASALLFAYFMAREVKNWLTPLPAEAGEPAPVPVAAGAGPAGETEAPPVLYISYDNRLVHVPLLTKEVSRGWPKPLYATFGNLQWCPSTPWGGVSNEDIARHAMEAFEALFKFITFTLCGAYLRCGPEKKKRGVIRQIQSMGRLSHGSLGEAMHSSLAGLADCDSEEWGYLKAVLIAPLLDSEPSANMRLLLDKLPDILPGGGRPDDNPYATEADPAVSTHVFQAIGQLRNKMSHFSLNGPPGRLAYLLTGAVNDLYALLSDGLTSLRLLHVDSVTYLGEGAHSALFHDFTGPERRPLTITLSPGQDLPTPDDLYLGRADGRPLFDMAPFMRVIGDAYDNPTPSFFNRSLDNQTEYHCYESPISLCRPLDYKECIDELAASGERPLGSDEAGALRS
ncbi:SecA DEAD domain protein [Pseudodesulfovibrio mercurii]|uniref:SecA DEAD domain protein n=1 Tax=Pseudodesulfovibrio mercurii TaxID=641491 RepID=F0JCK8_9BACT|nr:preprotein translocase subunit SecA [Pseudodesulfovibrio mercurii]EGB15688.1 SecA DEAD domain protein [Pseudodesulfovibrio mercurii]